MSHDRGTADESAIRRARLSTDAWLVLRQALRNALPEQDVPGVLRPASFGLAADHRVTAGARDGAWAELVALGVATAVPGSDDLSTTVPGAADGLKLLLTAPVRTVVHSWQGEAGKLQVVAWDGRNAVGASRRMRRDMGTLTPVPDGEETVEIVWLPDASPVEEIVRGLPPAPDPERSDTGVIGWEASYDESGAGQGEAAAPRLGDAPADGVVRLGSLGTEYDGGAQVTILRAPPALAGEAATQPVFTGLWVWTTPADARACVHPLLSRLSSALSTALYKPAA